MKKDCSVFMASHFIGKRWTLSIILEIYKGAENKKRYSELKKSLLDITPKVLSARLKELQDVGLIKKNMYKKNSKIFSEYILTKSGLDFINIIKEIKKWSLRWDVGAISCKNKDCKECEF